MRTNADATGVVFYVKSTVVIYDGGGDVIKELINKERYNTLEKACKGYNDEVLFQDVECLNYGRSFPCENDRRVKVSITAFDRDAETSIVLDTVEF